MTLSAESIFFAALERTDPAERAVYLEGACRGDDDLRRQVERLLEAHPRVGDYLQQPLAENLARDALASEKTRPDLVGEAAEPPPDFLKPSQKPDSLGRLDHYEILEVVGRGGMGVVLKGFDEKLHRVVAIKVMAPELAASGTARKRFSREARAAAAVSHDHVVTIHAVAEEHRPPYLVMQFVAGVSLQEKLDRGNPFGLEEILRIGLQTASGLAAAHRQGLTHRDIKPANILLENGVERVKITDFGLARTADDASLTQSGHIPGTPLYMSPEQAAGEAVDHRSDLFSLGSVLYALCTGRPPFRAASTHAVMKRVIDDTPRPIRAVNPAIPDWLCDVIARLHAKNPAERFSSADEVADLLGRQLARLQQPGNGAGDKSLRTRPVRRRRWAFPVAVALMLLGLVGGLLLAYSAGWLGEWREPSRPQGAAGDEADQASRTTDRKPAPEEVLKALRRVVADHQEHLRVVELQFEAERITRLEVCAAEVPLIEARIKLAAAEQKPVVGLLEELVRRREEELSQIQIRVEFGSLSETELRSAQARLSEARARLATARTESPGW